jgi:hypothetical protein
MKKLSTAWTVIGVVIILTLLLIAHAFAHSWYPSDCCSGTDCKPVPASDIQELPGGCFVYKPTGNQFCGSQVRVSQDKDWHVCISPSTGNSLCLFRQFRSF